MILNSSNLEQAINQSKSLSGLVDTPIIAVTARAMPHNLAEGQAAGFDDYLTKPLEVAPFLKTIDHFS